MSQQEKISCMLFMLFGIILIMKKKVFIFLLFCILANFSYGMSFKEQILKSKEGDFIVYEKNKIFSLIVIKKITSEELILEEISTNKKPDNWKKWVINGAIGNSSWTICKIDILSGKIIDGYSFSKRAWLNVESKENLFSHLLSLELQTVAKNLWRKIGSPPSYGEQDLRSIWYPTFYLNGKAKKANWEVYETKWPNDSSDFSNKTLNFYFTNAEIFFPIWLQVSTSYGIAILHAVDSGHELISPQKNVFFTYMGKD